MSEKQKKFTCKVTACDRNGRVLLLGTATDKLESAVITERTDLFYRFRQQSPDCQVYFNWVERG